MTLVEESALMPLESRNPIIRRTLMDDLTKAMLDFIAENKFQVGDRLPSLAALAKHFSVATPTIREMARRLESTGVLSIRHGSGIYLTGNVDRLVMTNPTRGEIGDEALLDLLDSRLLLEPELASRAATMRSHEQLLELQETAQAADQAISDGDPAALNEYSMLFHIQIGRIAGNKVLAEALESIIELHLGHQRRIAIIVSDIERDREEHKELLTAVINGDPAEARRLMATHLTEVLEIVKNRINEDLKE